MGSLRWWHLTAAALDEDEQGITLIEVMIATFILSVALLAMASVGGTSLVALRQTRDREQATNAASAAVEDARARDFSDLSNDATDDPGALPAEIQALLAVDGSGTCAADELIVQDAASSDPLPLTATTGTNGAHTVHTLVTWADEATACDATERAIKRVTTLVTWRDRGELLSVRNSTLVAPAGRGLPVPEFELRPPEAVLTFSDQQVAAQQTRCIPHLLRNIGSSDTYDWDLVDVAGLGSGSPLQNGGTGWKTPNGKFEVSAYLENPAPEPRGAAVPPNAALMQDLDGNDRPESDAAVANADRATFTVCYRALEDTDAFTATIELHSRFDERQSETITHQVSIAEPEEVLHLQDRDDTTDHPRDADPATTRTVYPPFVMTQLTSDPALAEDRTQELSSELRDWSTEIGSPPVGGLRLRRESATAALRTADWRYQFPSATQLLSGTPTLTLWVAPDSALSGDGAVFVDGGTVRMRLAVQLDALNERENRNNVIWPADGAITTVIDYQHPSQGCAERVVALPVETARDFVAGDRLRIRVTCLTESGEDCNLGYDATAYPSRFRVGLQ